MIVGTLETEIAQCGNEAVSTAAGIARLSTTRARQGRTSMIGAIVVEPPLESLAGDAQSPVTQGKLERGEIVADVFP